MELSKFVGRCSDGLPESGQACDRGASQELMWARGGIVWGSFKDPCRPCGLGSPRFSCQLDNNRGCSSRLEPLFAAAQLNLCAKPH